MFIIVADIVILLICVGLNWWSIRKTIKTRIANESQNLVPASTKPPISTHIAWILAAGVLYANLPFNDFINLGISIALLFGALNIQERIVNNYIDKKVALIKEQEKKKPLSKSARKRRNRGYK